MNDFFSRYCQAQFQSSPSPVQLELRLALKGPYTEKTFGHIYDVKIPQNHNEHGENFEKDFFIPFFELFGGQVMSC